LLGLN